ncbi:UDP-N-acetylglucosamine--N-acetylmuramyl-(pentapeptide) pyrophosphoryl-undecaprenol N-acetylglucosamine transferase [Microvirga flocculans]|uniref:UDP-N-acetylglucosamine--N-acetylmuramyl-(pentapeptide) pyrophosphoryl-undecaprenol N-acetylglucosamine transferase n=1 Tax=Microvirga flocculans TaxID=217168 RepID=A0A7W6ID92_9HYPH|nr:undecaprenyldiphospho-muramoylpentapeptide beta-N-acetylglucosaminyltransferase [Microvirga flocculans]MBB4039289.1 UDP-N-acetylglucosamine--N-acetylmuramyl-(pentapeptide) pyrophosphoryl-undecaprenol N-acetylglucosamine transferase [Microvirga flocculans]
MTSPLILLTAGGTGGHLFPAEALANALKASGARVALATDKRANAYAGSFPAEEIVEIPSATPSGRSLPQMAKAALMLGQGTLKAAAAIRRMKPAAVVGFGGYPTVPPVLAASLLKVPTVIHEANGVMGRANRLLARRATVIATGFANIKGVPAHVPGKLIHTGNPIRPAVLEAARQPYPPLEAGDRMRLLVVGGSQGARVMSDVVPPAIALLSPELRSRLSICQQARGEDLERVREHYRRLNVEFEAEPFFKDLPHRLGAAHLVVSRSGASTVAELAVIGRPSILVPLPGSLDQDQAANAKTLGDLGAAIVCPQTEFTPERLADEIRSFFQQPDRLTKAAVAAHSASITDAAERLAQAVLHLVPSNNNGKSP